MSVLFHSLRFFDAQGNTLNVYPLSWTTTFLSPTHEPTLYFNLHPLLTTFTFQRIVLVKYEYVTVNK